jgi:hypothetical protein
MIRPLLLMMTLEYHLHVSLQLIHNVLSLMKPSSKQIIEIKTAILWSLLLILVVLPLVERILSLRSLLAIISILLRIISISSVSLKIGIIRHSRRSLIGLIVSL